MSYTDPTGQNAVLTWGTRIGGGAICFAPIPGARLVGLGLIASTIPGLVPVQCSKNEDSSCPENTDTKKPAIPDVSPRDNCEAFALAEAKAGAGEIIMTGLGDEPRLVAHYGPGPWVKKRHKHTCADGRVLVIHYFSNLKGLNVKLKFKAR